MPFASNGVAICHDILEVIISKAKKPVVLSANNEERNSLDMSRKSVNTTTGPNNVCF
jgi:hypothetical protein